MKFNVLTFASVLGFSLLSTALLAQEVDLTGIKCVVSGQRAAKNAAFVEYKGGKVYFCCNNCVAAFKADMELKNEAKFNVKANHQLVLTGQFVQVGCPFSGGAVDPANVTEVGGTKVGFCNGDCCDKVASLEKLGDKAQLVFSEEAFKKAFRKKTADVDLSNVKCMMMPAKGVSKEHSVDYKDGKVFFCCGGCAKKFAKDPKKFATQANQQLVATGQFVQSGCPISGGDVDDEQASEVGGVEIKFCCHRCKGKVDSASDEASKAELVFSEKRFDKSFSKK